MIIDPQTHLLTRAREYLPAVDRFTFPIFIRSERGDILEHVASGIAVSLQGALYLVTAEHAIQEVLRSRRPMLIADSVTGHFGNVYALPTPTADVWKFHPRQELDLAVAQIDQRFDGLHHFPLEDCMLGYQATTRGHYFLAGYPAARNKTRQVNPPGTPKASGIASIIVHADQTLVGSKDPREHLAFHYKGVHDDSGRKPQGISLKGMSGCGIWYFHEEDATRPRLSGVLIEHHRSTAVGYASMARHLLSWLRP